MVTVFDIIIGIVFIVVLPIALWIIIHQYGTYGLKDILISIVLIVIGVVTLLPQSIKRTIESIFKKEVYK